MRLMLLIPPERNNNLSRTLTLVEDNIDKYVVSCHIYSEGYGGIWTGDFLKQYSIELKRKED